MVREFPVVEYIAQIWWSNSIFIWLGTQWLILVQYCICAGGSLCELWTRLRSLPTRAGLVWGVCAIVAGVLAFLLVTAATRWRMTVLFGVLMLALYVLFISLVCLLEFNVFAQLRPPPCPRHFGHTHAPWNWASTGPDSTGLDWAQWARRLLEDRAGQDINGLDSMFLCVWYRRIAKIISNKYSYSTI